MFAPLQSRFAVIELQHYNIMEFLEISRRVLTRLGRDEEAAMKIGKTVWHKMNRDIRQVIHIGKLC